MLRLLGWNIHKLWSTDWWEAGDRQIEGVLKAINTAEGKEKSAPQVPEFKDPALISGIELQAADIILNKLVSIPEIPAKTKPFTDYEICSLEIVHSTSSEDFLQPVNRQKILSQIRYVVEIEAPISRNLLCKRVLGAWGITRLGGRLSSQFDNLFAFLKLQQTGTDSKVIFWKEMQIPAQYTGFRVGSSDGTRREAEDLPAEEVANAVKYILENQISLTKEELVRETAKLFNYGRIGSNVEVAMVSGIDNALSRGFAAQQGERVIVKE